MGSGECGGSSERDHDGVAPDQETEAVRAAAWDLVNDIGWQVLVPLKTATPDGLPRLRQAAELFDARIRCITEPDGRPVAGLR